MTGELDYSKLLGFETLDPIAGDVDFKDETVAAKLGAKVGDPPPPPQGVNENDK